MLDELVDVVRHKLSKSASVLSNDELKALWCALDGDSSDSVQKNEMARARASKRASSGLRPVC